MGGRRKRETPVLEMAVKSRIPTDLVLRDADVSELYVRSKLERQAAFNALRALLLQIEHLVGKGATARLRLPDDVRVQPLSACERRIWDVDEMAFVVENTRAETVQRCLPESFDVKSCLIVSHCIDRGSIGSAAMNFAMSPRCGYLFATFWGPCHDGNNSAKSAAKKTAGGLVWRHIVKMAAVANFNHGPFRSGSWGLEKQETLAEYQGTRTCDDPGFVEAATMQANLHPDGRMRSGGAPDLQQWWRFQATLRSCTMAGPVVKFARWGSIEDTWEFLRPEIYLVKPILELLARTPAAEEGERLRTAHWDAARLEKEKAKGPLKTRVATYITRELVQMMDCFCLAGVFH